MTLPDASALSSVAMHALTAGYLVTMMLSMGLELGGAPKEDKAAKRKQRRLLLRGLALNLVLLPLVVLVIVRALHPRHEVAMALLLLAATPGGRFAPHLTRIAGGNVGLSIEITLFLAKLTGFTAPPTVEWILGTNKFDVHELTLILQLALLQMIPYLIGKRIRHKREGLAVRLRVPVQIITVACIVGIVGFLVWNHEIRSVLFIAGGGGWVALLLMAAAFLTLGWLFGGPSPSTRRAVALSVSSRDLPLALMIANLAHPTEGLQSLLFAVWLILLAVSVVFAIVARRQGVEVGRPPMVPLGLAG